LQERLLSEKSFKRGIFQPETVKRMFDNHVAGKEDNGWQLWTLLMLELWFESFID